MEAYLIPICGSGVIVALFGLGVFLIVWGIRSRKKAEESSRWPTVVGSISEAFIQENRNRDSDGYTTTTYIPKINYQYQIGGQIFTGNRFTFGFEKSYGSKKKAQEALTAYPVGGQINVFYNPQKPEEAVLEQKAQGSVGGIIAGIILVVIMLCLACPGMAVYLWNNF